jgi:hypothetical protein
MSLGWKHITRPCWKKWEQWDNWGKCWDSTCSCTCTPLTEIVCDRTYICPTKPILYGAPEMGDLWGSCWGCRKPFELGRFSPSTDFAAWWWEPSSGRPWRQGEKEDLPHILQIWSLAGRWLGCCYIWEWNLDATISTDHHGWRALCQFVGHPDMAQCSCRCIWTIGVHFGFNCLVAQCRTTMNLIIKFCFWCF